MIGQSKAFLETIKLITKIAVNDAPVLDTALAASLGAINEDAPNPVGTLVWSLVNGASTDPDAGARVGPRGLRLGRGLFLR